MRINIVWPQGTRLPVRIPRHALASELARMLRFFCASGESLELRKGTRKLVLQTALDQQGIEKEDEISVTVVINRENQVLGSSDLYQEMLRLNDLRELKKGDSTAVAQEEEISSDASFEPPMVVQTDGAAISEDPLPSIWSGEQDRK